MSGEEEGLLVADIDLADCVAAKLVHDYSGHYNRPDIFTLTVNRRVPSYLHSVEGTEAAPLDETKDEEKIVDESSVSQALSTLNRFVQQISRNDAQQEDPLT